MECPDCGVRSVTFEVPPAFREHAPENAACAGVCPECLALSAAEPPANEEFRRISEAFPTGEAAAPMALAVGLLDSLALHRQAIEELLAAVETAGVDPLLVLDRLATQGATRPSFDIGRRRHQLEQLLD